MGDLAKGVVIGVLSAIIVEQLKRVKIL